MKYLYLGNQIALNPVSSFGPVISKGDWDIGVCPEKGGEAGEGSKKSYKENLSCLIWRKGGLGLLMPLYIPLRRACFPVPQEKGQGEMAI